MVCRGRVQVPIKNFVSYNEIPGLSTAAILHWLDIYSYYKHVWLYFFYVLRAVFA
jgi:hypothetical protein